MSNVERNKSAKSLLEIEHVCDEMSRGEGRCAIWSASSSQERFLSRFTSDHAGRLRDEVKLKGGKERRSRREEEQRFSLSPPVSLWRNLSACEGPPQSQRVHMKEG